MISLEEQYGTYMFFDKSIFLKGFNDDDDINKIVISSYQIDILMVNYLFENEIKKGIHFDLIANDFFNEDSIPIEFKHYFNIIKIVVPNAIYHIKFIILFSLFKCSFIFLSSNFTYSTLFYCLNDYYLFIANRSIHSLIKKNSNNWILSRFFKSIKYSSNINLYDFNKMKGKFIISLPKLNISILKLIENDWDEMHVIASNINDFNIYTYNSNTTTTTTSKSIIKHNTKHKFKHNTNSKQIDYFKDKLIHLYKASLINNDFWFYKYNNINKITKTYINDMNYHFKRYSLIKHSIDNTINYHLLFISSNFSYSALNGKNYELGIKLNLINGDFFTFISL